MGTKRSVKANPIETLYCKAGEHEWDRERKRGKKPVNCPEHTTAREQADREAHMEKMRLAREAAAAARRAAIIAETIETQEAQGCRCPIKATMTLRGLNRLSGGCTGVQMGGPGWVCPVLDRLRRRLGH